MTTDQPEIDTHYHYNIPLRTALLTARDLAVRSGVGEFDGASISMDEDGTHVTLELDSTTEGLGAFILGEEAAQALGLAVYQNGHGWSEWAGDVDGADVTVLAYYEDVRSLGLRYRLRRYLSHPVASTVLLGASAAAGSALTLAARRIGGAR